LQKENRQQTPGNRVSEIQQEGEQWMYETVLAKLVEAPSWQILAIVLG
jgi:hypothetical protein